MLNDTSAKSSNEVIIDNYKVILPPGIKFVRMFSQQSNETVTGWEFSKEGSSAYYFVYKAGPSVYESFVSPKGNKGIILGYFRNVQDALNAFNGG